MPIRLIVAWALITLLAAALAFAGWRHATRHSRHRRHRRHERSMRDRWLGEGEPPLPDAQSPLPTPNPNGRVNPGPPTQKGNM